MSALYVFYVNRGYLVALDYETSLKSVRNLQVMIHEATGISTGDQVLLAGNGSTMEPDKRVSLYAEAGSVSKPVFLFARSSKSEKDELTISQQRDEVLGEISMVLEQGDVHMTTRDRHNLYRRLAEHARACLKVADTTVQATARIVQEHTHLNGGWIALVCNLDETVQRLERKQRKYEAHVRKLAQLREKATELFEGFDDSVEQLKLIRLPPSMQPSKEKEITLFDWIAASDPNHSLQDLLVQVKEQLESLNGQEAREIGQNLAYVKELIGKPEHREIRGINKRISQIEHTLSVLIKHKEKIQVATQTIHQHNTRNMDDVVLNVSEDAVEKHLVTVNTIHDLLRLIKESCALFFKSKSEVLENVRKRLYGWVVTAYEKLHHVHMGIVVFEEKFTGLKQRLDLVRQVKETPLMFATCITEILRRGQLQKEFRAWHTSHNERCLTFSADENQLRSVFSAKLEKHFLRVIFQGMFDKLPVFFVKHIPEFDQQLPPIETEYYRELRKSVSSLEAVLRVNSPQVNSRLSGRPTSLASCSSQANLRREESFISYEQASNLTTNLHNAFPSNAWLTDEGLDMSPSTEPAPLMVQSPLVDRFLSGQCLPSLHDIHATMEAKESELEEAAAHLPHSLKSAPITIPTRKDGCRDDEPRSHFSTPDDRFTRSKDDKEEQFGMDDISTRSQMMEVLRPMAAELGALNKDLLDTRADLLVYRDRLELDVQSIVASAGQRMAEVLAEKDALHEKEKQRMAERHEATSAQLEATERSLADMQQEMVGREQEIGHLRESLDDGSRRLDQLQDEMAAAEERFSEERSEIFKKLTIEFELEKDREASEYRQTIEEKEEEIRQLQRELEKKQAEIEKLKKGPGTEEFRRIIETDTRANLEREFKTRVELLSKGLEQKKEEAMARIRKDVEFDFKRKEAEKEAGTRLLVLERDLLRAATKEQSTLEEIAARLQKESEKIMQESHLSPFMSSSSPRPSPRKPFGCDSMHGSLTSPIPSSPPEDTHIKSDSEASEEPRPPSSEEEEHAPPKIIPPPEHLPEVKETREETSSDSCETTRKDSSGSEKRAGKRRSSERSDNEGKKTLLMEESFMPGLMGESMMPGQSPPEEEMMVDESQPEAPQQEAGGLVSNGMQTRLTLRSMDYMVALNDIREGSTVLVIWDDRHHAYILFCLSNFIHFVKETSVRRLGLTTTDEESARKNWVLARVAHVDLCIIKKATNRYKLPVDTQVYRVDVMPVAFDAARSMTIPSSREP